MRPRKAAPKFPIERPKRLDDDDAKACDFDFCQLGFLRSCVDESTSPVVVDERLVLVDERPRVSPCSGTEAGRPGSPRSGTGPVAG